MVSKIKEQKSSASVFEFKDYRKFLATVLSTTGEGRGSRSRLAQALRCQTAFVSQVIHGQAEFSLEHAIAVSKFLNLSVTESHFFLLLVQLGRAGTRELKEYFEAQIQEIHRKREQVKERVTTVTELPQEALLRYYSAWYYAAIHVATSVPTLQTREALSQELKLSPQIVAEALEFLLQHGLVLERGGRYLIGPTRVHLGADSALISKHHSNWRLKSLQSLEAPDVRDIHYSAVVSLSQGDVQKMRELVLKSIEESDKIVRPSPEECVYGINLDWFRIVGN